jgi:hypothetical protein
MQNKSRHYVNNKQMYQELIKYRESVAQAEKDNKDPPKIPAYIAECFLLIAKRLSNKPNFIGYTYKEDMIMEGVENCLRYILVFDPKRSNMPFAYFTQTIKNAFLRRIKSEKRQFYLKCKSMQSFQLTSQLNDNTITFNENDVVNGYIKDYEGSIQLKKEKLQREAIASNGVITTLGKLQYAKQANTSFD